MATIKIIDDDKEFATNIAGTLLNEGHSVTILNSTEKALETLTTDKPDLLILDVMFPENPVAGFELARKIRKKKGIANLPIILLTAVNREFPTEFSAEDIDHNWIPVQDFLEKPVKPDKLLKSVQFMLNWRAHNSQVGTILSDG
jgi:CheY-like chemotaxis protein